VSQKSMKLVGGDQGFSTEGFPFHQHLCTTSRRRCRLGESTPNHFHLHSRRHGPTAAAAPQQVCH
jgi:hypothetical protein